MAASESYAQLASERGLGPADGFAPGPVTPLMTKGGGIAPALRGPLADGVEGVIGRYSYGRFDYNVVFARIPESQPFVPRLICERRGRITDDTQYGFEIRNSRLWTESAKLNERFKVTVSPFQDDIWLRRLFIPTFIDWLGERSPGDFSFELTYGSMLCSVEQDDPDAAGLEALWEAGATVAKRVSDESRE
ncbi:MAG: hypothetical protein QOI10_1834 [Solirubrobacterales bacterium]|jgi:hypothetical protein|nr:hypothetical protein [Solirubrobacterales bacterium]